MARLGNARSAIFLLALASAGCSADEPSWAADSGTGMTSSDVDPTGQATEALRAQCRTVRNPTASSIEGLADMAQAGISESVAQRIDDQTDGSKQLILIAMGEQPSGGFSAAVGPRNIHEHPNGNTYALDIDYNTPDGMATMALTYPCTVIQVPSGPYSLAIPLYTDSERPAARETVTVEIGGQEP